MIYGQLNDQYEALNQKMALAEGEIVKALGSHYVPRTETDRDTYRYGLMVDGQFIVCCLESLRAGEAWHSKPTMTLIVKIGYAGEKKLFREKKETGLDHAAIAEELIRRAKAMKASRDQQDKDTHNTQINQETLCHLMKEAEWNKPLNNRFALTAEKDGIHVRMHNVMTEAEIRKFLAFAREIGWVK